MTWLEVIGAITLAFLLAKEVYDLMGSNQETITETWRMSSTAGPIHRNLRRIVCNMCEKDAVYFMFQYTVTWFYRSIELDIESLCEDHAP